MLDLMTNCGLCLLTYSFRTPWGTRYVFDGCAFLVNRIAAVLEVTNIVINVENPVFTSRSLDALCSALFTICDRDVGRVQV